MRTAQLAARIPGELGAKTAKIAYAAEGFAPPAKDMNAYVYNSIFMGVNITENIEVWDPISDLTITEAYNLSITISYFHPKPNSKPTVPIMRVSATDEDIETVGTNFAVSTVEGQEMLLLFDSRSLVSLC